MAKDADARYSTAGELASAFADALAAGGDETRVAPATPVAVTVTTRRPAVSRHRGLLIVAVILALAVAAAVAVLLATHGSSGGAASEKVGSFVDRTENVLLQSAAGRREIGATLAAGMSCTISPAVAAQRIASAADNRQSILGQLGNFESSTPQTDEIVTILQQALQHSIETDRHYRNGFLSIPSGASCPLPTSPGFELAAISNESATAAKRRFVAAFNPLAQRFHRRTWSASEF